MVTSAAGSASQQFDPSDARTQIALLNEERDKEIWREKRVREFEAKRAANANGNATRDTKGQETGSQFEIVFYAGLIFAIIGAVVIAFVYLLTAYLDSQAAVQA